MLTMVRTEAIPFEAMKEGFLPHWDWETIPEYLDSLDGAPKGVNCIQYMPTASLMTYVMGLEAAKTRPATNAERKEMQRLLHEGMDAGLCGFSIQRLGPELDPGRLRRHAHGHRHHGRRRHLLPGRGAAGARRGLHPAHPGHQRQPERPRRPRLQAAPGRGRPAADHRQRGPGQPEVNPRIHRKRLDWLAECPGRRPADLRPGRHDPHRLRVHARELEPLRRQPGLAGGHHRRRSRSKMRKMADPALRERIKAETDVGVDTCSPRPRAASAARPASWSCTGVGGRRRPRATIRGQRLDDIADEEGKHYIDVMLDLAIETELKTEFLGAGPAATTASTWPASTTSRPTRSPACPTAAPTRSSSTAAPSPPTS